MRIFKFAMFAAVLINVAWISFIVWAIYRLVMHFTRGG